MTARILIVEDEGIVALHIHETLLRLGHSPLDVVSSGEEAIMTVATERPDLVLMDIKLKGDIDGIAAARAIRDRHHIPVVFLTAYTDESTLARAKVAEPYGFIVKPFEERELKSIVEITLHKHDMERRVYESREWLATTLHAIGDAVVVLDPRGDVKLMNAAAERIAGVTKAAASEASLRRILAPIPDAPTFADAFAGKIVEWYARLPRKEGAPRIVEGSVRPVTSTDHEIIGRVVVFRDVTERRAADASRARLAAIVDASEDAIVSKSLTGEVLTWNPGAEALYGYSDAEIVARSAFMLSPPERHDELRDILAKIRKGERVIHRETQRVAKDGRLVDVAVSISPLTDEHEHVTGAVFIERDITETKRHEVERKRAEARIIEIERLREINRLKTDFINAAAHELRTPLTPIRIQLELLARDSVIRDPARLARSLELLSRNFGRLSMLVDDILARSRANAEASKFVSEPTNLREVVEEATAECRSRAQAAHVSLANGVNEDAIVAGDKTRLRRVVEELISAAVASSRRNASVNLVLEDRGEYVALEVIASAARLDAAEIDEKFDTFEARENELRALSNRSEAVHARDIIDAHGGRLVIASEGSGRATTFTLELPRRVPGTDADAEADTAQDADPRGS